jgi:hypothetical protein
MIMFITATRRHSPLTLDTHRTCFSEVQVVGPLISSPTPSIDLPYQTSQASGKIRIKCINKVSTTLMLVLLDMGFILMS